MNLCSEQPKQAMVCRSSGGPGRTRLTSNLQLRVILLADAFTTTGTTVDAPRLYTRLRRSHDYSKPDVPHLEGASTVFAILVFFGLPWCQAGLVICDSWLLVTRKKINGRRQRSVAGLMMRK
jgi:hypothetical protein